jgi:sugar lactone lactonase YvrE
MPFSNCLCLFFSTACRAFRKNAFSRVFRLPVFVLTLGCSLAAAWSQSLQLVPTMQTFAGTGAASFSGDNGFAINATLNSPEGIAFDSSGNTYISDYYNHRIRVVNAHGVITTAYGTGTGCSVLTSTPNACGDGGPAADATFEWPTALLFDGGGNLYIVDYGAFRVRRIDVTTGNISTVAGTGNPTYNGDGIAATTAGLVGPHGIAIDSAGNLYISDLNGNRIRKIAESTGLISTVAGTGTAGYTSDGIQAATAELDNPSGIAIDASGNLYIADLGNERIREVAAGTGVISTIAGSGATGFSGDGSLATSAQLDTPSDVHLDSAGNVYVADEGNARVREIFIASGLISTIAGDGSPCSPTTGLCGDGGPSTSASLTPAFLGLDPSGNLYVVDQTASRIRTTSPNVVFGATSIGGHTTQNVSVQVTGAATSITSIAVAPSQGGVQEYTVGTIGGCVVDGSTPNAIGTICTVPITFRPGYPDPRRLPFVAVTNGGSFHFGLNGIGLGPQFSLSPGTLSTLAGVGAAGYGGDNGPAASAALNHPLRTATDAAGNVYIADAGNNVIREVLASTGNIVTIAGNGTACATPTSACGDGALATSANLNAPADVTLDAAGDLFISDTGDNRVRRVDANTHIITTFAGTGVAAYGADGSLAANTSISSPQQTIVDTSGNVYIVSLGDNTVRFVSQDTGTVRTIAGDGTAACSSTTAACGDGGTAGGGNSMLHAPTGIALDTSNNLYIADAGDNRIRRVDEATGKISTVAGTGNAGYTGDGAAATAAELNAPHGVSVDAAGDLYIADRNNAAIRMLTSYNGVIGTIVGNGSQCATPTATCGDTGLANTAALVTPQSVTLDSLGNLYIADSGEDRVRKVSILTPTLVFASTTVGLTSSDSPKVETIYDIGNATLLQPPPVSGFNPSVSTGFALDSSSTCLELTPSSATSPLFPGEPCTYAVDFSPETTGTFYGAAIGTDNSLNVTNASQTVLLQGVSTDASTATTLSSSQNPSSFGQTITLSSHIISGNGPVPTGTVTFYLIVNHGAINLQAAPASTTPSQMQYLGAGTYTLSILGASNGGLYNGWNPSLFPSSNDQWTSSFGLELCGSCDATIHQMTGNPSFSTAALASSAYQTAASLSDYYPASGVTTLVANPFTFTLTSAQSVSFYVPAGPFANGGYTGSSPFSTSTGGLSLDLISLTPIGTGTVNGSAVATLAISTLPIGSDSILAVYSGDGNYVGSQSPTIVQVVNKAVGPDTLTTSNATPNFGEPVTFTDTIPIRNGVTPTGTVTFYNGATSLGIGNVNTISGTATATLTTTILPVGSDSITAVYTGDGTYATTTAGPLTETVTKSVATDTLTTSNASPVYETSITLTDTIQIVDAITPTGTVTFYNGATSIGSGSVNSSGVAILITNSLPPGSDSITASYSGDAHYAASVSNVLIETVARLSATDTLTSTNTSPNYGQSITLTDTIPTLDGVAMTGSVTFYNGATAIGSSPATNGQATLSTSSLPAGSDSITAVYSGNADYNPSTSSALIEIIAKLSATDTLTTSNATPTPAQSITLTDTLPSVNSVAASGTVTFYNGTSSIGASTVSTGSAVLAISLPLGINSITAVYSGDSHYNPSTSNAVIETVAKLSDTDTLTVSNATPTPTQSVTLTDAVHTVNGQVMTTGTVTFYHDSTSIGAVTVASGTATLIIGPLSIGVDTITAVYSGDGNYNPSNSNALTLNVAKLAPTATLTTSTATPTPTQSITLTDTLPTIQGVAVTGTVTFYSGTTAIGTGTVASGAATLSIGPLPIGVVQITAVYSGDANYSAATSNLITETVAKLSTAATLTTSNAKPRPTQSFTLTAATPIVNGMPITGTVTFYSGSTVIGSRTIASATTTLTIGPLPVSTDVITASYSGDANYTPANSNALTETIAKLSTSGALTTSNATPVPTQSFTLADTVPTLTGVPITGTITFYSGTNSLGAVTISASGNAALTIGPLPVASDVITAVYSGDSNYSPSTSNALTETIAQLSGVDSLTASNTSPTIGQSITLNDAVPTLSGIAPTGTVTFFNGATAIGTVTIANGSATLTTTSLPAGALRSRRLTAATMYTTRPPPARSRSSSIRSRSTSRSQQPRPIRRSTPESQQPTR